MKSGCFHSASFRETEGNLAGAGSEALELTTAHPAPPPLVLTWLALSYAASTSRTVKDISLPCEKVSEREKLFLVAAAALHLKNLSLLQDLKWALYGKQADNTLLITALEVCIAYQLEEIAVHIVEVVREGELLPLYVVHRAGEQGMMRLLKGISDLKVKICCPHALQRAIFRLKLLTKGLVKGTSHRFQTSSDYLSPEDVLTWAILTGAEAKAREVLGWGLAISDLNVGKLLLSEGLISLFDSLVKDLRISLTPAITVLLLKYREFTLLSRYIEVKGM